VHWWDIWNRQNRGRGRNPYGFYGYMISLVNKMRSLYNSNETISSFFKHHLHTKVIILRMVRRNAMRRDDEYDRYINDHVFWWGRSCIERLLLRNARECHAVIDHIKFVQAHHGIYVQMLTLTYSTFFHYLFFSICTF